MNDLTAEKNVTMTCCGSKYATIGETVGHECPVSPAEDTEFAAIHKAAETAQAARDTFRNTDGTVPGRVVQARHEAMVNTRRKADKLWDAAGFMMDRAKFSRFTAWVAKHR